MSEQRVPEQKPGPRRARSRHEQPGARRPLRERLTHPHPPKLSGPAKKALGWTGAVLAILALLITILILIWDWNWFRAPLERVEIGRAHV